MAGVRPHPPRVHESKSENPEMQTASVGLHRATFVRRIAAMMFGPHHPVYLSRPSTPPDSLAPDHRALSRGGIRRFTRRRRIAKCHTLLFVEPETRLQPGCTYGLRWRPGLGKPGAHQFAGSGTTLANLVFQFRALRQNF